jgi:hypothetical protein
MRKTVLPALVLLALVATGAASAWEGVTVRLSPPPSELRAGTAWHARLEVLNPEGRPFSVPSMAPGVTIRNRATGEQRAFLAQKTARPGVFDVRIVFPADGRWSYRADAVSGELGAPAHRYGAVTVGAAGRSATLAFSAGGGAAIVLAGGLGLALVRRGRLRNR